MSGAKFKVGDRVLVRKPKEREAGWMSPEMDIYDGGVYEIQRDGRGTVRFKNCLQWAFRHEWLEPAPAVKEPEAPQPKFQVGDRVRVIATDSGMFQKVGVVKDVNDVKPMPYHVEAEGKRLHGWFTADELELAPFVNESLTPDNVNHPPHYNQGGIECIEAIKAALGEGFHDYLRGNVLKYLWRYKQKGGIEDLRKSAWYLDRLIQEMGDE